MKKIAASILGKENKGQLIDKLVAKGIEYIHYDVMDGKFVPNISLPILEVKELIKFTKKHYSDVHLMVLNPSEYVEQLIGYVDQVSVHIETIDNMEDFIDKYFDKLKLGIVVNPDTDIRDVFPFLNKLNHIMIMSVIPGKGGQTFIESSIEKIKLIKNEIISRNLDLILEIDGGINDVWGPVVFKEGINIAVSGSYLINNLENNSINKILNK